MNMVLGGDVHQDDGSPSSDFTGLIPGIRDLPEAKIAEWVSGLRAVLERYRQVVFADLNICLNLLLVTLIPDMMSALRQKVPEARLVGHE